MRNIIMMFARKMTPIFIAFGWVTPLFKIKADAGPASSLAKNKPQTKKHSDRKSSGKKKTKLYSRRLTRNLENYSKD